MGLILGAIHLICLILVSVKAEQSEQGGLDYLRVNFPVEPRMVATKGKDSVGNGCSCANKMCSCCAYLNVPYVIHETACVNISYVSADLGLKVEVILGGSIIYSGEISVKNPPPICIGIPYVKKYAKICLDLYNIHWQEHVGGCIKIEVKLFFIIKHSFDLGCFNITGLDKESKIGFSKTLLGLKIHQLMLRAMKHQIEDSSRPIII